jgi:hypothetical protein
MENGEAPKTGPDLEHEGKPALEKEESEPATRPPKVHSEAPAHKRKIPIWAWIGTGVILLALTVFALSGVFSPSSHESDPATVLAGGAETTKTSAVIKPAPTNTRENLTSPPTATHRATATHRKETPTKTATPTDRPEPTAARENYAYLDPESGDDQIHIFQSWDYDIELVRVTNDQVIAWRTGNGRALDSPDPNEEPDFYMALDIDDNIIFNVPEGRTVIVSIGFFDSGHDKFRLQYDAYSGGPYNTGIFKPSDDVQKTNSNGFKTADFILNDAMLANRCNGYDFRIDDMADGAETIRSITVRVLQETSTSNIYFVVEWPFSG